MCGSQFSSLARGARVLNSSGQAWWKCLPAESSYGPFTGIFKTRSHQVTYTGLELDLSASASPILCVDTFAWLTLFICSLCKKLLKAHDVPEIILNEQHRGSHLMKPFSDGRK